jgi:single-strand DNA-binding protein
MATSETYKDRVTGEKKEITDWHNIVLWRGLAEIAQKYLHKGDMVYIEGKMRTRSWEKDGVTRYTTEVIGDNMTMLSTQRSGGSGSSSEGGYSGTAKSQESYSADSSGSDDLPF